jgi:hypothetical protein
MVLFLFSRVFFLESPITHTLAILGIGVITLVNIPESVRRTLADFSRIMAEPGSLLGRRPFNLVDISVNTVGVCLSELNVPRKLISPLRRTSSVIVSERTRSFVSLRIEVVLRGFGRRVYSVILVGFAEFSF